MKDVTEAVWAAAASDQARELQQLLRELRVDNRHPQWKQLTETLQQTVASPLAKKFPGVTDEGDAASTLFELTVEKWLGAYLDAVDADWPAGKPQPFGRFLERRLRDHFRERLETRKRRDDAVMPTRGEGESAPDGVDEPKAKRALAEVLVEAVEQDGRRLDTQERLRVEMTVLLREAGYTQAQIGTAMGTSTPTVNRWLKAVSAVAVAAIAGAVLMALVVGPPGTDGPVAEDRMRVLEERLDALQRDLDAERLQTARLAQSLESLADAGVGAHQMAQGPDDAEQEEVEELERAPRGFQNPLRALQDGEEYEAAPDILVGEDL